MQALMPIPSGAYRAQPTAMDIAADGTAAVILSYGEVLLFPRRAHEPWTATFARKPVVLAPHGLTQAEGIAFAPDHRTIYVTGEGSETILLRYKPAK
jgi:hypothetical protein